MAPRLAAAVLLVVGCGSAWAQRGRNPRTPPDAMTASAVQDLFRQARAAIQDLPAAVQPRLLLEVARDQLRQSPQQGIEGLDQAFDLALGLTASQATEKEQVEREVVYEMALRGEAQHALELTRQADVPKAPLYDSLIELAGRREFATNPQVRNLRQAAQQLAGQVMDLVQECERSDGAFPYRGALAALRRESDPLDRLDLTRAAYTWAGNESDPDQIQSASFFLAGAHHLVPELDGMLAGVLSAQLTRLAATTLAGPLQSQVGLGNRLMHLLLQVDPARAEELAAQFPNLGAAAVHAFNLADVNLPAGNTAAQAPLTLQFRPGVAGFGGGRGRGGLSSAIPTFSTTVAVPAEPDTAPDTTVAGGRAQFLALLARAEASWRHQPGAALAWANQAAGLLDAALWQNETPAVVRLATVYRRLNDNGDSNRLLAECLRVADRQAAAADAAFFADPAQAVLLARGYGTAYASVLEVYSLSARLDFATTATHAEQAQIVLLKPAVLTRVALIGEVAGPGSL